MFLVNLEQHAEKMSWELSAVESRLVIPTLNKKLLALPEMRQRHEDFRNGPLLTFFFFAFTSCSLV